MPHIESSAWCGASLKKYIMENTVYVLTIECAFEETAQDIQNWVNNHFNSAEVFWNEYHKK